jgi:hypothetical protein
MNEKMYKKADSIIENSKITYGDKMHLNSIVKRSQRLEEEVVRLFDENDGLNEEFNTMMLSGDYKGTFEKKISETQKENDTLKKENILYKKQVMKLRKTLEVLQPRLDPEMLKYIKDTIWEIDTLEKTIK